MSKKIQLLLILTQILVLHAIAMAGAADSERSELSQTAVEYVASKTDHSVSAAPEPLERDSDDEEKSTHSQVADAPEIRRLGKHHTDKSVAGGGVIIGGLVTAIFAAVFCYIRVTRKRSDGVDAIR